MCQEILVDGQEIQRSDGTCWCPLNWTEENFEFDGAAAEQEKAFAEFGRHVYSLLCKGKHPSAPQWITEVVLRRW